VRALYDSYPKDKTRLSFSRRDLINVLSRLDSGWWDGLLGEDRRGWLVPGKLRGDRLRPGRG
ncbi:hypothetical protein V8E36_006387, partial [Tilletia maclaganii]